MRYPQFFATRKIIERLEAGEKGGIIWHTQGSGKTALAAFSNRIIRDYYAKKRINTRFFFVVDRLDLLTQASNEFTLRGYNAINVSDRESFASELNKVLSTNTDMKSWGDFTVVNIHKFTDKMPMAKNDYNAKIQRVFFVDEAHRSYARTGEFFKNLMLVDRDAVFIALTGTPLLNKKERSNLKFGDYIHKYFYDKSIADGYTLRIKKETIGTLAKTEIKRNLDLENPNVDKDAVYQSDAYIVALCKFIQDDFKDFTYTNNDKTIGGMIVCNSNPQAKKVHAWFQNNSKDLTTGLVITDDEISTQANKETQLAFKETLVPDILVVHQMLTTGYDVKRLKKMYLLRNAKQHTLLQTISRVNRPYTNKEGKHYKYGYIVDFVDVEAEYDRTIKQYLEELEAELSEEGEEHTSLDGLVIDKETINNKYQSLKKELDSIIQTSNLEEVSKALIKIDKEKLYKLRRVLSKIKECHTEFLLSRAEEYAKQIDTGHIKRLLKVVQNRIDFVNLTNRAVDTLTILSNKEVVDIIYQFIKVKISIMDLGKYQNTQEAEDIVDKIKKIQKGIKDNKHKEDIRIVKLNEYLQKIFNMLEIVDLNDLSKINEELLKALEEIERINKENERLAAIYGGNYAFVKTYNDYCNLYPNYGREDIEAVLICVYHNLKDIMEKNAVIIQGRNNFITNVQQKTTKELLKAKLYKKLNLKEWYTQLIGDIYVNLQIYK
nr:DEAD/DEAH box helicase family protein [Clostridium pascui]